MKRSTDRGCSRPIRAAAVVGVILNLAVFFAYHVLWPKGFASPLDARTLFLGFE